MDNQESADFRPPYLPFKTFWSFIEELRSKPLPPALDRSMLRTKSGTDQANLLAALKSFRLISGESHTVESGLRGLVAASEDEAKRVLEVMLRTNYSRQFQLSEQNATEKALTDSFEEDFKITGETRRKAVTFFLQGARFAGIALSPHFPTTRLGSGRTTAAQAKRTTPRKPPASTPVTLKPTPPPVGDSYQITLQGGGTVTVTVAESHFNLSKNRDDRKFVNDLVDAMTGYAEGHGQDVIAADPEAISDTPVAEGDA